MAFKTRSYMILMGTHQLWTRSTQARTASTTSASSSTQRVVRSPTTSNTTT